MFYVYIYSLRKMPHPDLPSLTSTAQMNTPQLYPLSQKRPLSSATHQSGAWNDSLMRGNVTVRSGSTRMETIRFVTLNGPWIRPSLLDVKCCCSPEQLFFWDCRLRFGPSSVSLNCWQLVDKWVAWAVTVATKLYQTEVHTDLYMISTVRLRFAQGYHTCWKENVRFGSFKPQYRSLVMWKLSVSNNFICIVTCGGYFQLR